MRLAVRSQRPLTHPAASPGPLSGPLSSSKQPLRQHRAAAAAPRRPTVAAAGLGGGSGGERHERPREHTLLNALGSSERAGSEYGEVGQLWVAKGGGEHTWHPSVAPARLHACPAACIHSNAATAPSSRSRPAAPCMQLARPHLIGSHSPPFNPCI